MSGQPLAPDPSTTAPEAPDPTAALAAFAEGRDEAQTVDILRKTWRKMSDRGRQAALALPLAGRPLRLVEAALAG